MPRVYGKRPHRLSVFQANCFASSSPLKSPSDHDIEIVTAKANLSPLAGQRACKTSRSNAIEDITILIEGLDIRDEGNFSPLRLEPQEDQAVRRSPRIRKALQSRNANSTSTESSPALEKKNIAERRTNTPARPAVIATELRSALERHPNVDGAIALVANSDGTVESTHGSPFVRKEISVRAERQGNALPTPPASPTPKTRPRRVRRVIESSSPEPNLGAFATHTRPLLDLCNDPERYSEPACFASWASDITQYFDITKIAEASYGEVYRLSLLAPYPTLSSAEESVLKIIALTPPESYIPHLTKAQQSRLATHSAPSTVASEVRLLQRMSPVPGFANFRECHVLRGRPPPALVSAWRTFNRTIRRSEFPDPGRKSAYPDDQLWAVLEMQDAGQDLEETCLRSVWEVWDVFWGVALALAKGEEWARFEHRDLHLGNICVRWPEDGDGDIGNASEIDITRRLGCTGLETTLIDYTLSRADMSTPKDAVDDGDADVAFFDLATDPAIFAGDADIEYQYDMYRYMRAAMLKGDALAPVTPITTRRRRGGQGIQPLNTSSPSSWRHHEPLTNLVWLHFVLHCLCAQLDAWPSSRPKAEAYRGRERLDAAHDVEGKLAVLEHLLELEGLQDRGLGCAAGLAGWAVAAGWFDEEDVLGCR